MHPEDYEEDYGGFYSSRSDYVSEEQEEQDTFTEEEHNSGRPERETLIQEDEVTNLRIALGTTQDVNAFVASI